MRFLSGINSVFRRTPTSKRAIIETLLLARYAMTEVGTVAISDKPVR